VVTLSRTVIDAGSRFAGQPRSLKVIDVAGLGVEKIEHIQPDQPRMQSVAEAL